MRSRSLVLAGIALALALAMSDLGGAEAADVQRGSQEAPTRSGSDFALIDSFVGPTGRGFGLAHDGTNLWFLADNGAGTIYKLGPSGGTVLDSFPAPGSDIGLGLALDGTNLYITDSNFSISGLATIFVLDPADGSTITSFPDPGSSSGSTTGLAYLAGSLYALDDVTDTIYELDPSDGTVLNTVPVAGGGLHFLRGLGSDGTNLVAYENVSDEYLVIDPADGSIVDTFSLPTTITGGDFQQITGIAFDGGTLFSLEIAFTNNSVVSVFAKPSAPPPAVGGIAREPEVSALPAAAESRPGASGFAIANASATAGALALGATALYARRRLS